MQPSKMHFQPGLSNSGILIPQLGIGMRTQTAADYGMPFHFPSFNHSSSSQFLDESCLGNSEVETLIISPPLDVSQIDDLTAIVNKCSNVNAFAKPSPSPPQILPGQTAPQFRSNKRPNVEDAVLPAQPAPQFRSNKRPNVEDAVLPALPPPPQFRSNKRPNVEDAEGNQKAPRGKRCGGPLMKDATHREIHILSERQRRSGMNELLSKMSSFLPNQTAAKSDTATIIEETINYIRYLQRRLDIRIEKQSTINIPQQGAETPGSSIIHRSDQTAGPSSVDTILCNTGASSEHSILPKISLNSHGKDLFITMKCGKKAEHLSSIILVVEGQNLNVMDAFVSTDDTVAFYCLHAKATETLGAASREALEDTLMDMIIKAELQISLEP